MKYATAYIMTLNGKNLGLVLEMLNEEAWIFKKQIGAKLQLRYTPDINFRVDDTFTEVDRIENLLRNPKVAQDLAKPNNPEEE
ncbi:MAG: ribosome-binding factor A [Alphaproteobacteria bacterium]|nr:ribosome-binding factor A [Alphaproteobacteria bacterium]